MGRIPYLVNAFFGIIVGLFIVYTMGIYPMTKGNFNSDNTSWLIAGIISIAFGYYQYKKYKSAD